MSEREKGLREFEESFTAEKCRNNPVTTFQRDVDFVEVQPGTAGLLPWSMVIPVDLGGLAAMKLKWLLDVDEMFYLGDESVSVKGLINGGYESNGHAPDTILVEPIEFARLAVGGEVVGRPCKWLQLVDKKRFEYRRSSLVFNLAWPRRSVVDGSEVFIGGVAPLSVKSGEA